MKTKTLIITATTLILLALAAGILLWEALPAQMASHWNAQDEVDGYMSKAWGVFLLPLMTAGLLLLFLALPGMDPLRENIAGFRAEFNLFALGFVLFMLYLYALTLAWGLGARFAMSSAMLPALGLLLALVGRLMRTARRNFFIGIRTPWTLSSDAVWQKTHNLGATLFTLCGGLTVLGGLAGGAATLWLTLAPLLLSSAFLVLYSYLLYRREQAVPRETPKGDTK